MPVSPTNVSVLFLKGDMDGMLLSMPNEARPGEGMAIQSTVSMCRYQGCNLDSYEAIPFGRLYNPSLAYLLDGASINDIWTDIVAKYAEGAINTTGAFMLVGGPLDKQFLTIPGDMTSYHWRIPREPRIPINRISQPVHTILGMDTVEYTQRNFRIGDNYFIYYEAPGMTAEQVSDKLILAYRGTNGSRNNLAPYATCIPSGTAT